MQRDPAREARPRQLQRRPDVGLAQAPVALHVRRVGPVVDHAVGLGKGGQVDQYTLEEAETAAILAPERERSNAECAARLSASLDDTNDAEWDWIGDEANNFSMTNDELREISPGPIAGPAQDHQACQHASAFYDVVNEPAGGINQVMDDGARDGTLYAGFSAFNFPSLQQPPSAPDRCDTRGPNITGSSSSSSSSSVTCAQPAGRTQTQKLSATPSGSAEPSSDVLPWDHRLSNLCLRLSTRLQQFEAILGRSEGNIRHTSSQPNETAQVPEHQEAVSTWTPKLLGEVLGDTAEYLAIAQSYKVLLSEKSPAGGDNPSARGHTSKASAMSLQGASRRKCIVSLTPFVAVLARCRRPSRSIQLCGF